jgi:hypothetical protein
LKGGGVAWPDFDFGDESQAMLDQEGVIFVMVEHVIHGFPQHPHLSIADVENLDWVKFYVISTRNSLEAQKCGVVLVRDDKIEAVLIF